MLARYLPWPLPALLAWALCWLAFVQLLGMELGGEVALALATLLGVGLSVLGKSWWRRLIISLGFPLSLAASGVVGLPAWAWLIPMLLLLLVYPLNAWRDAPIFPTPANALTQLPSIAVLPPGARIFDAGCGLGHGLQALRQVYPQATLHGIEWSWPLAQLCRWRCPWANVARGDIWRANWSNFDMVYLFQRPESMARAITKAKAELRNGSWLVSLEFEATGLNPLARLEGAQGKPVWVYQMPLQNA
jgi:hypothetical protein